MNGDKGAYSGSRGAGSGSLCGCIERTGSGSCAGGASVRNLGPRFKAHELRRSGLVGFGCTGEGGVSPY